MRWRWCLCVKVCVSKSVSFDFCWCFAIDLVKGASEAQEMHCYENFHTSRVWCFGYKIYICVYYVLFTYIYISYIFIYLLFVVYTHIYIYTPIILCSFCTFMILCILCVLFEWTSMIHTPGCQRMVTSPPRFLECSFNLGDSKSFLRHSPIKRCGF